MSDEFSELVGPVLPAVSGRVGRPWLTTERCWRGSAGVAGRCRRGGTCRRSSGLGRPSGSDISSGQPWVGSCGRWVRCRAECSSRRPRPTLRTHRPRCWRASRAQGAGSNYTSVPVEPADHALGRSRGGCRPVTMLLTAGQSGDNPQLPRCWTSTVPPVPAASSGCWATRPTPTPRHAQPCATGRFRTPSPNGMTRRPAARPTAQPVADRPLSTPTWTNTATPSNEASTGSSSDEASPPALASTPAPTSAAYSRPPTSSTYNPP